MSGLWWKRLVAVRLSGVMIAPVLLWLASCTGEGESRGGAEDAGGASTQIEQLDEAFGALEAASRDLGSGAEELKDSLEAAKKELPEAVEVGRETLRACQSSADCSAETEEELRAALERLEALCDSAGQDCAR